LRNNPYVYGTKKLRAHKIYKNRVGGYRILFNINNSVLEIAVIAIRKRDNRTYK
jgi:mRNA-degrading endonuclease RelE of RelBE toxin-antitoxin system